MVEQRNPLGELFRSKDKSNPSINLLETSKTNIIINQNLAQILVTLQLAHNALESKLESKNWSWLDIFIKDCYVANHNIDGVPRLQFIEGLKADAIIQQEVEKRRLMVMNSE